MRQRRSPVASASARATQRSAPSMSSARHIVFIAWRDLANPDAGGSELLVDRLARGLTARGDRVTLLCGGAVGDRPYEVRRSGGTYTQFARAPFAFRRHLRDCDLIVEVCNGMPYLAPLWTRRPVVCLVNHVHTELWRLRFPPPLAALGRLTESAVMPWVHRDNLFLTVSASTFAALREIGVDTERIRLICNGVEPGAAARAAIARAAVPRARPARRLQADRPAAQALGPGTARHRRPAGHRRRRTGARPAPGWPGPGVDVHRPGVGGREAPAALGRLAAAASGQHRGLGNRRRRGRRPRYAGGRVQRARAPGLGRPRRDRPAGQHRGRVRLGVGIPGDRRPDAARDGPGRARARPAAALVGSRRRLLAGGRRGAGAPGQAGQAAARPARSGQPGQASQVGPEAAADEPVVADAVGYLAQPSGRRRRSQHERAAAPLADPAHGPARARGLAAANPLRDFYEDPAVPASSGPDRAYRQAEMLAEPAGDHGGAGPDPGRRLR